MYLSQYVFVFKKSVIVNSYVVILYLPNYTPIHRRAYPKVPGMRGLYIGVHNSCSFTPEPFLYKYIISVTISSFWSKKCTIGNIYFPQSRWREEKLIAFDELDKWLKSHSKSNHPTILVGISICQLWKLSHIYLDTFPIGMLAILVRMYILGQKVVFLY